MSRCTNGRPRRRSTCFLSAQWLSDDAPLPPQRRGDSTSMALPGRGCAKPERPHLNLCRAAGLQRAVHAQRRGTAVGWRCAPQHDVSDPFAGKPLMPYVMPNGRGVVGAGQPVASLYILRPRRWAVAAAAVSHGCNVSPKQCDLVPHQHQMRRRRRSYQHRRFDTAGCRRPW